MRAVRPRRSGAALALALLAVGGVVVYETAVAPRPYYVTQIDAEQDYYYNARMIAADLPVTIHHPGTPIYYLGYALLQLTGDDPAQAQQFLNHAYVAIAWAAALGLIAFWGLVLRDLPFGVALGALAAVVAWPPFLTYLNFFNADAFIVAVGLPAFAVGWRVLQRPAPSARVLVAAGALLGVCLAVKMSFVPLVLALACGYASHALRQEAREQPGRGRLRLAGAAVARMAPFGLGLGTGVVVAILPVVDRVPRVLQRTFTRPDAAPRSDLLAEAAATFALLARANAAWLALAVGAIVLFTAGTVLALRRRPDREPGAPDHGAAPPTPAFDAPSGALTIGLLIAAFVYTAAAAAAISPGAEAGIQLRNMSPTALGIPFAIVFGVQTLAGARAVPPRALRAMSAILGIGGALAGAVGIHGHLRERGAFVAERMARIATTRAALEALASPPARVAFWTESAQDFLGDASFHFWGSYRYANGHFDASLLLRYPRLAFFGLRNLRAAREAAGGAGERPAPSRYGWLGDTYWAARHALFRDRPHYTRTGVVVSGQGQGTVLGAIAVPSGELAASGLSEDELVAFVARRYGTPSVARTTIAGVDWTVLRLDQPQQVRPAGQGGGG